jgi:hypothetical protein
VPANTDLHVVAVDGDFRSRLFDSEPNPYLAVEWTERNGASLHYYRSIRAFTAAQVPAVELPAEVDAAAAEIEVLLPDLTDATDVGQLAAPVRALVGSGSFRATHAAISGLRGQEFTDAELRALVRALTTNGQVGGIVGDADVHAFYEDLYQRDRHRMAPAHAAILTTLLQFGDGELS